MSADLGIGMWLLFTSEIQIKMLVRTIGLLSVQPLSPQMFNPQVEKTKNIIIMHIVCFLHHLYFVSA